jgi:hypothetical protein
MHREIKTEVFWFFVLQRVSWSNKINMNVSSKERKREETVPFSSATETPCSLQKNKQWKMFIFIK